MSCIENINRYIVPNDVIKSLTKLYTYIGRNECYEEIAKNNMSKILEQTVQRDAFFLAKLLNLDLTDARLRLIITKKSSPRNREETILFNLIDHLTTILNDCERLSINSSEQLNIINYIYKNQTIKFDAKEDGRFLSKSKRLVLEELTDAMYDNNDNIETLILVLSYFVDIYSLKAFTDKNEASALLTLFLLLIKNGVECFKYISFFELLTENYEEFNECLLDATYSINQGFSTPTSFIRFMINLFIKGYEHAEKIIMDYREDQSLSKGDNIENTINDLPEYFTKEDIRLIHPYVSDSTINRALKKLRDEKKIAPDGKGRSAKWKKLNVHSNFL